jgi:hypothetical protein
MIGFRREPVLRLAGRRAFFFAFVVFFDFFFIRESYSSRLRGGLASKRDARSAPAADDELSHR